jgi:putative PIN family toxin of toxin-antitoxin system
MKRIYHVVIDTNVIVAALRSKNGASNKILSLIDKNIYKTHSSVALILEYEDVLKRFTKETKLSINDINMFIDSMVMASECHKLFYLWRPCLNDPGDEMILELAVNANVDYIITHNIKDFNQVKGFKFRAITPKDFLELLGGKL